MSKARTLQQPLDDDKQSISELIVTPRKATCSRKKPSFVWAYFGPLCRVTCGALSTSPDVSDEAELDDIPVQVKLSKLSGIDVVDDQLYYCALCLEKIQGDRGGSIRDVKSYSLASSTDTLHRHLIVAHNFERSVSFVEYSQFSVV